MCMARPRGHARGTLRALCRDEVALGGGSKDGVGGSKDGVGGSRDGKGPESSRLLLQLMPPPVRICCFQQSDLLITYGDSLG